MDRAHRHSGAGGDGRLSVLGPLLKAPVASPPPFGISSYPMWAVLGVSGGEAGFS